MHTTVELLDALKKRYNLTSDYQLAKFLGFDESRIAHYRAGRRFLSDETALKVAELLGKPAGEILALIQAERASSEAVRKAWERAAKALAGTALALTMGCGLALGPLPYTVPTAEASRGTLYIMLSLILAWLGTRHGRCVVPRSQ